MLEKCRRWLKKEYWLPRLKRVLAFCLNPRLLLCLGIGWFLTNGWAYVAAALGTALHLPWLAGAGGAWLAILWIPFTPEKIVTVAIAMFLLKLLFPNDTKTLAVLRELRSKIREKASAKKTAPEPSAPPQGPAPKAETPDPDTPPADTL